MILWLAIGLFLGAFAVWLVMRTRIIQVVASQEQSDAVAAQRYQALSERLEHEQQLAHERSETLIEAREQLSNQFKALSAEALRSNSEQLLQQAKAQFASLQREARNDLDHRQKHVVNIVDPIKETLTRVDRKIEQLERDRRQMQGELTEQLRKVASTQDTLASVLAKPQSRGRWGEFQLRRVVELAGMLPYSDFQEQQSVGNQQDGIGRPDLVINMPGGRHLVVDAKAPVDSLFAAQATQDKAQQKIHFQAHAKRLRAHVKELSSRRYQAQLDTTPDFVLLFLPGEHFYNAALEVDPALIEDAVRENVIIATPTTLIALLRAIAYGWRQEQLTRDTQEIIQLGERLHERLSKYLEHVEKVGKHLGQAVSTYNGSLGALESRVLVSARQLAEHGVAKRHEEQLRSPGAVDSAVRSLNIPTDPVVAEVPERAD